MKFPHLATGLARLWAALKSHPVELLILVHAAVSSMIKGHPWWIQPSSYAAFAVIAAFCLSRSRKGMNWGQWVYLAVLPLYALTVLLPDAWPKTTEFAILNFLLPFAYLLTYPTWEGQRFSERFYRLLRSMAVAIGIAVILYVLLRLVGWTVDLLFLTDTNYQLGQYSAAFCFILFAPMLFISMESHEEQPAVIHLVEVIINYVLTPALLIYNTILYVYLVTILVNWDLPKSSVSTMVMVFTILAIAIRLIRPLLIKQPLAWYFRWFSLFVLPLVVLFWVSVGYRVGQYGITVDRCLLIAAGALMTLYLIGTLASAGHQPILNSQFSILNYTFTALVVFCGVVLAVGGPLSAKQVALRSQAAIVREKASALGILTPDGKLDSTRELFFRNETDTTYCEEHRTVYQSLKYIEQELSDTTAVRATLGMTAAEYLDRLSQKTSDYASSWRPETSDDIEDAPSYYLSCYNEKAVDISGFRHMVVDPESKRTSRYLEEIPYPGGSIPADTLLATQLAKIGYTLSSNLDQDRLDANECDLCRYQSPDGNVLILFHSMTIERKDSLNHITYFNIDCILTR